MYLSSTALSTVLALLVNFRVPVVGPFLARVAGAIIEIVLQDTDQVSVGAAQMRIMVATEKSYTGSSGCSSTIHFLNQAVRLMSTLTFN